MTFKEKIVCQFSALVNTKIDTLQNSLKELSESAKNETKSTAGDKHETALAMLQIEQENLRKQLSEAIEQKHGLEKIDITYVSSYVVKGSLIKTNKGYFFMSLGLGRIIVDDIPVIALSPQAPLGIKFMGSKANDAIDMNGTIYTIEQID